NPDRSDERQVRQRVGQVERRDDAGSAQSGRRDDQSVQVSGHSEGGDVHHRSRDDLIGSHRYREPRVHQAEQRADEHRDDDAEGEGRSAPDRAVQSEAGEVSEERGHEHDALDADVHDARPLADDPAECPERERCREVEEDREHVRQDRDEIDRELPDEAQERADQLHQDGGPPDAVPAQLCVMVLSSVISVLGARIRKTRRTMRSAARNRITRAWMMSMTSMGTLVWICMSGAPARNAPKRMAAKRIPMGLDRPRSATAMESNPTDAVMPGA